MDEREEIVDPFAIPDPPTDWVFAIDFKGRDLSFEYSVNVDNDGSISAHVHLQSRLGSFDTMEIIGRTINDIVRRAPDGYEFSDAMIDHEYLNMYFFWTNGEFVV